MIFLSIPANPPRNGSKEEVKAFSQRLIGTHKSIYNTSKLFSLEGGILASEAKDALTSSRAEYYI